MDTVNNFGLGTAAGGEKIGYYSVSVAAGAIADSAPADHGMTSTDGSATWNQYGTGSFGGPSANGVRIIGLAKTAGETVPSAIQDAALTLVVSPRIAPQNQLPTSDDITVDGSATFEVIYL
ncbi:hypothetical protein [Lysobacter sp. GCM10012299]|uniref:hypothetical protein n=1 Tax=Lysobacter sp. GCM10012299 TaxID=3317333 RepID=UPI0036193D6F